MGDLGIAEAVLLPYALAFSDDAPLRYGRTRIGRLVQLKSASGLIGWGEAAPLPGFSLESVDDIDRAWPLVEQRLSDLNLDRLQDSDLTKLPPSLVFALEQAVLAIDGQARRLSPPDLLSRRHRGHIRVSGLVDVAPDQAVGKAVELTRKGCTCIKVKVGLWSLDEGVRALSGLRAILGPDIGLRLDANRNWSLDQATRFLSGLDGLDVTYIEEPLRDPSLLGTLSERSTVPIAIDESLVGIRPDQIRAYSFARYAIVKPTILGGIQRSCSIARIASNAGITPVVSSSFESGLATLWLVALASVSPFDETAGLDTLRFVDGDLLDPKPELGFMPDVQLAERVIETPTVDD